MHLGSGFWDIEQQVREGYRISRPKIIRYEKRQDPSSSGKKWTYVVIVFFLLGWLVGLKKEMLTK